MDGQRQKTNGGRRRRRRAKGETKSQGAPVLIAARRPDSPRLAKVPNRNIAASAQPKKNRPDKGRQSADDRPQAAVQSEEKPRRAARIAEARRVVLNEDEQRRELLLERLAMCEGRSAISRIADELLEGAGVPEEQQYQIQLLEHIDERRALGALEVLSRLFDKEQPIKRPILDQRLRRLEDEADEPDVRLKAGELRKRVRTAQQPQSARAS